MSTDYQALKTAVNKWALKNGISFTAEFVPQQLSRNSAEKGPSINWRVTIARNKRGMATDYTQGIGHVPGWPQYYKLRNALVKHQHALGELASEKGKYFASGEKLEPASTARLERWLFGESPNYGVCELDLPKPDFANVLQGLVMDSEGVEVDTFEEWADNYGYDTDSRKAEKIYEACREIARDLRRVLGQKLIDEARELTKEL